MEYEPQEYNDLLKPVVNGFADVVYGSRFMGGNSHRILFYWRTRGNKFLTTLSNMLINLNLTDMETCYKLFMTELIQTLHLKEKRFGFEPEIRVYEEGKQIGWKDGFRALYSIIKYGLLKIIK